MVMEAYHIQWNYRRYNFSIVGTKDLMESIKEKLKLLNINLKTRPHKSIYDIHLRGNRQINKLMDYLYNDSTIFLERKFQKYDDFITWDGTKRDKKINYLLT